MRKPSLEPSKEERGTYARRAMLVSGIVVTALAAYSTIATILWYPDRWAVAAVLGGFGLVLLALGSSRAWIPREFR